MILAIGLAIQGILEHSSDLARRGMLASLVSRLRCRVGRRHRI